MALMAVLSRSFTESRWPSRAGEGIPGLFAPRGSSGGDKIVLEILGGFGFVTSGDHDDRPSGKGLSRVEGGDFQCFPFT